MVRYVVLEFEDNDAATAYIGAVAEENRKQREEKLPFSRRVVGVFVKPGRRCECGDWDRANYRGPAPKKGLPSGVVRGAKFGWWVCTRCSRPRRASHSLTNQLLLSQQYQGRVEDLAGKQGVTEDDRREQYETQVDSLSITGISTKMIPRDSELMPLPRKKKKKKGKK